MKVVISQEELAGLLRDLNQPPQCLADTGFLYALAYVDDRLFNPANDLLDTLSDYKAELYVNVVSRMEFVDLIFRKQVTRGCIELFNTVKHNDHSDSMFNLLKDIRDKDTAARRRNQSYKIDERRLKKLRDTIGRHGLDEWQAFCQKFVGSMLVNEWTMTEKELGLNFIEIMEGTVSEHIHSPLKWADMVGLMGSHGLRGPDAMILNLFASSRFSLLITTDSDFESFLDSSTLTPNDKAIFFLEQNE